MAQGIACVALVATMQFHHGKVVQHVESGRRGIVVAWYPWHEWIDDHGDRMWHDEMQCFPGGKMMVQFSNNAVCMRWMHRYRPIDEGRAMFLRQAPQWIGPRPPRVPFRDGEVPPPPPAQPPAGTNSHGRRIRLGQRQRQQFRADRDRHVALWHAQEEARERQEFLEMEGQLSAEDLADLEMHEATDAAATQEEQAREVQVQEVPTPMPHPPHMPHAALWPPHVRFAPAWRDRHERLQDRIEARVVRDRNLSPRTFIEAAPRPPM